MKLLLSTILFLIFSTITFAKEELLTINTLKSIEQNLLVTINSANPKAILLLFSGSSGNLKFYKIKRISL